MKATVHTFAASGTSPWIQLGHGPHTLWLGAAGDYTFGGGTLTVEVSDENNNSGARALKESGSPISVTANSVHNVAVGPCYVRFKLTGATDPDLSVAIEQGFRGPASF